ncbi:hypothetical protein VNO77_39818 [Canavalia gladiata]|uniref:chorismate mutase n=1 Tax=Canavalia gladiata TaxID=3824 RepID=A0AAN9JZ71_CANGL
MEASSLFCQPHQYHDCKPISTLPSKVNIFFRHNSVFMKGTCRLQLRATASSFPISLFLYRDSYKTRVDESKSLTLDSIRHSLIRQEDSIIFSLLERAQYAYNVDTYEDDGFFMNEFNGSLVEYMVWQTEKLHAQVGRYESPDEHAFFPEYLPRPMLPPLQYPQVLHHFADSININNKV